jgi:hypothetical protein
LPVPRGLFPDPHPYLLPLPEQNPTQYQLVELDWNTVGHPPIGVYNLPHLDFHFYTISLAERDAIVPGPDFVAQGQILPSANFWPPGYVADPMGVPMMGVHWTNQSHAEFHGAGFTSTFIYGSWNGRFTFVEPMVTRAYLLSRPDIVSTIEVPTSFEQSGYHPTAYRVTYDARAKEYRVGIMGLTANQVAGTEDLRQAAAEP